MRKTYIAGQVTGYVADPYCDDRASVKVRVHELGIHQDYDFDVIVPVALLELLTRIERGASSGNGWV